MKLSDETQAAIDKAFRALDAIEDIKAEIDEQYDRVRPYDISCAEGLEMALEIIEKHTKI